MSQQTRKVMVLAGGPDRERAVSLQSGAAVAAALVEAGHEVIQRDIGPDDLSILDAFKRWEGQVIFPVLHGPWGEGGPLQRELDQRGLAYVGSRADRAALCMDKVATKRLLEDRGLPTPAFELVAQGQGSNLEPPVVVKPPDEGSSVDLVICRDRSALDAARDDLHRRHRTLLVERYIQGREITVGVLADPSDQGWPLPPLQIIPAVEFYDYQAKYESGDTRYTFDIDLPRRPLEHIADLGLQAHQAVGARHLSRVDFMVDSDHHPWILEINTMPGFTSHSLLPMAARHHGLNMAALTDRLIQSALEKQSDPSK